MPETSIYPDCECCGGGGIETTCCENGLPETLYLTITSGCSCVSADTPMVYDAGGSEGAGWYTAGIPCNGNTASFGLVCNSGNWSFYYLCNGFVAGGGGGSGTCDPLDLTVSATGGGDCCAEGAIEGTITE
jgi:hypothetical protein